ncbi:hypothetical protein AB0H76_13155 [Nocardia sp. NPDC050712]|uniref:hypothetical protein n=1 Tax=Nocardia sp. NPDC050712 TaxID=3155518 RepID=UPI0033E9D9BC
MDPESPSDLAASRATGGARLRWTATAVLLVLVAILGTAAVLARFARGELLDTDRYVQTVAPLATDPAVQAGLADRITDAIMERLDVETLAAQALAELAADRPRIPPAVIGLAPVIGTQARDFVHDTAESVVTSEQFGDLWVQVNRQAHRRLAAVLAGDAPAALSADDSGAVSVSLAPMIERVRTALLARGFTLAEQVPAIDKSFVVFRSPELVEARRWVALGDRVAGVLPWVTLLAAVGAVLVAPKGRRLRALSWVGVVMVAAMALLAVAIAVARSAYLQALPAGVLSRESATVVIDALLVPLRNTLRAVFVLAVVTALVGFLLGPARLAVAIRGSISGMFGRARSRSAGHIAQSVGAAVWRVRGPLRVGIVLAAAVVVVFWRYPTGLVIVLTVLAAVVALIAVERVARPPEVHP